MISVPMVGTRAAPILQGGKRVALRVLKGEWSLPEGHSPKTRCQLFLCNVETQARWRKVLLGCQR